jgi:hypothetical protein
MNKYYAQFMGRTKYSIGMFSTCRCFVDGTNEETARLALYNDYEHIQQLKLTLLPIRYVVTYINKDGVRELAHAMQGRHTYETPEAAQAWIDAATQNNSADTLRSVYGNVSKLAVRPCHCWPVHFDPIGRYFDTEDK